MKNTILLLALFVPTANAVDVQNYRVLTRFKNGTISESYLQTTSYAAAKEMAQAQCGGPSNCTVTVYWEKK